jgi:hypothetical protein
MLTRGTMALPALLMAICWFGPATAQSRVPWLTSEDIRSLAIDYAKVFEGGLEGRSA